jgi:hypothetical protein
MPVRVGNSELPVSLVLKKESHIPVGAQTGPKPDFLPVNNIAVHIKLGIVCRICFEKDGRK